MRLVGLPLLLSSWGVVGAPAEAPKTLAAKTPAAKTPAAKTPAVAPASLKEGFHSDIDETSVSTGYQHTCVIEHDGKDFGGTPICWGNNDHNQASAPKGHFIQVSAGQFHSCGVKIDETVECWGMPGVSQNPTGLFHQVSAGSRHTCGIVKDKDIRCWGKNTKGQTNNPNGKFVQVSCGKDHCCAIRVNGLVECWGDDTFKTLAVPDKVQFKQISASFFHHSCGIDLSDNLHCWGVNGGGQSPKVSSGYKYTCAIKGGDEETGLVCWGDSSHGQHSAPNKTFEAVSMGYQHACGVTEDAAVECWGNEAYGAVSPPREISPA